MKNLADVVLHYYWFLNFCSDDELDPDTAVKEMESLADTIMNSFTVAEREELQAAAKRSLTTWLREPDEHGYTPRKLLTEDQRIFLESIAEGQFTG
jgi:predicted HicB family RNase H-like nuclease